MEVGLVRGDTSSPQGQSAQLASSAIETAMVNSSDSSDAYPLLAPQFDDESSPASPAPRTKAKLAIEQLWRLMACTTPSEHQV